MVGWAVYRQDSSWLLPEGELTAILLGWPMQSVSLSYY